MVHHQSGTSLLEGAGLVVRLFGTVEVSWNGQVVGPFPTRQAEQLFAYLALHRSRLHARDVLAGVFWGDLPDEMARKRLRTTLWRVRCTLGEAVPADDYVRVTRDRVGFVPRGSYWLDVEQLEARVRPMRLPGNGSSEPAALDQLVAAVGLYRGDLLEGVYDEWCQTERDRLRTLYLDAVERLMRHYARMGKWAAALDCGNRIVAVDPLREQVHRRLMVLYYISGDRPRAIRQFAECRETLRAELGIDPMRSTLGLRAALELEHEHLLAELVRSCLEPDRSPIARAHATPTEPRLPVRETDRIGGVAMPNPGLWTGTRQ